MLDVFYNILLFLHVLVCGLLVLLVMMQRPKQEGLGSAFASGMMNELAGAQTTDVLQKGTRIMGIAFFVLAGTMSVIKAAQFRDFLPPEPDDSDEVEAAVPAETDADSNIMTVDPENLLAPETTGDAPVESTETPAEAGVMPAEPTPDTETPAPAAEETPAAEDAASTEAPAPTPEEPEKTPAQQ